MQKSGNWIFFGEWLAQMILNCMGELLEADESLWNSIEIVTWCQFWKRIKMFEMFITWYWRLKACQVWFHSKITSPCILNLIKAIRSALKLKVDYIQIGICGLHHILWTYKESNLSCCLQKICCWIQHEMHNKKKRANMQ